MSPAGGRASSGASSERRLSEILRAIAALNYLPRPVPLDALAGIDLRQRRSALWRMLVAMLCMMQAMMYAVPRYTAGDEMPGEIVRLLVWAELLLTVPVLVFCAGPFFQGAWRDLRARRIGMDTPVALGIAVAFGASLLALGQRPGRVLRFGDDVHRPAAGGALARNLRPRTGHPRPGRFARPPAAAGRPDRSRTASCARCRGASSSPATACWCRPAQPCPPTPPSPPGKTAVDESLLTGESRPLPRGVGAPVVAGSLNLQQPIEIVVDRLPTESRLAQLHQLVERATASKPALLRIADRWARRFLAAILGLGRTAPGSAGCSSTRPRAPWIAASC